MLILIGRPVSDNSGIKGRGRKNLGFIWNSGLMPSNPIPTFPDFFEVESLDNKDFHLNRILTIYIWKLSEQKLAMRVK